MDSLFNQIWQNFSGKLADILPHSPLADRTFFDLVSQYMGWVNWIIPVGLMLDTLGGVLACLGVYYLARVILRLLRVVY